MLKTRTIEASLLLNKYDESWDQLINSILTNSYTSLDPTAPTCRYRGTIIRNEGNHYRIIAWQRNVARIRKMDVSLPAVLLLTLNNDLSIDNISLHPSFKGSKGLMCSVRYLQNNLQNRLTGAFLGKDFINKIKIDQMHCFHLFEILSGLNSFFHIQRHNIETNTLTFEEEASDKILENDTLSIVGNYKNSDNFQIHYRLRFINLFKNIGFKKDGVIQFQKPVRVQFFINNKIKLDKKTYLHKKLEDCLDMQRYLFLCIFNLKKEFQAEFPVYNTNLYPLALIGLLTQAAAIKVFQNNYNYVMHALTALQRHNNIPRCIGAIKDQHEVNTYFPEFDFSKLV